MVGAPKASGGYGITSLPRSTGIETTQAPTTGKAVEQKPGGGRENNPVLRSLMTDSFEGHGAQGRGLALGHLKKAGKGGEAPAGGAAPGGAAPAGGKTPADGAAPAGAPQDGIQKFLQFLEKLLAELEAQKSKPGSLPGNNGTVPPKVEQGAPTAPAPASAPAPALTPYAI
jgi:hypothetical protein